MEYVSRNVLSREREGRSLYASLKENGFQYKQTPTNVKKGEEDTVELTIFCRRVHAES